MHRRNVIILASLTILIVLIIIASLAPRLDAPLFVSPLALQSPLLVPESFLPLIVCSVPDCPTPEPTATDRPTPSPEPTETPLRPTP